MTGGHGTGHGTGYDAGNGHAGAAAQSRNGPRFGMIPLRVATLRLPGRVHAVLVVIAFHAKGRWGFVSLDTIANETGIDRSKVCRCIRWLETKGVIEVVRRGGGAGLANAYRVIPDAEAAQPPPRETAQPTAAENSAVFGTETTAENSADCGAVSDENSAVFGTPIEENIEERTPPSGESRAREGESFSQTDWVDKKQWVRLRSIDGGLDRRLAALKAYNPSAATIEFAAEQLGVNARDPHVLGKFIDYHCSKGNPPADCDAAYRYWISNEWRFAGGHNVRGSPKQSGHSRFVEGIRNRARTRGYDG